MQRTGTADLPLHGGRAPRWLFNRMVRLAGAILEAIVVELGPQEVLRRLQDPFWFQAFGALLGFDWHSSGLTTTTTGAIKEALKDRDLGLYVAGGKGRTSRKTPDQIRRIADRTGIHPDPLIYASRMTAKVDSAALQDGYQIYHHVLIFTQDGQWVVIQQGMNPVRRYARRYHWSSEHLQSFVLEPHTGIAAQRRESRVLDLTAKESVATQEVMVDLVRERPEQAIRDMERLRHLRLPRRHELWVQDLRPESLKKILLRTYERAPASFEELLGLQGVGPKTIRALALVSDIIYGATPSYQDPAVYAFAHGGKDGYPYPVNRRVYERSIDVVERAIRLAKLGHREKLQALRKLGQLFSDEEVSS